MERIAFFWNRLSADESVLAEGVIAAQRPEFLESFEKVLTCQFSTASVQERLQSLERFCEDHRVQFAVLSHRPAWVVDPSTFSALLRSEGVRRNAVSIRAGMIQGKGFIFSPKFPYIDGDFIIINVKRCAEIGVFERSHRAGVASHFASWGGIHAELASVLEAVVPYGDLHVYSDGSDCQDMYGECRNFAPSPYLYSHPYGFLSTDPRQDDRVHALRAELLVRRGIGGVPVVDQYKRTRRQAVHFTVDGAGMPFCWRGVLGRVGTRVQMKAKQLVDGINYEIQKKYEDKT